MDSVVYISGVFIALLILNSIIACYYFTADNCNMDELVTAMLYAAMFSILWLVAIPLAICSLLPFLIFKRLCGEKNVQTF